MTMLADRVDAVIGVDTHKHTHTAAVVTPTGGLVDHRTAPSDAPGAGRLLAFARDRAPGRRAWAIDGSGGYGAGLTSALLEQGEWVIEVDRPRRPARRNGATKIAGDAGFGWNFGLPVTHRLDVLANALGRPQSGRLARQFQTGVQGSGDLIVKAKHHAFAGRADQIVGGGAHGAGLLDCQLAQLCQALEHQREIPARRPAHHCGGGRRRLLRRKRGRRSHLGLDLVEQLPPRRLQALHFSPQLQLCLGSNAALELAPEFEFASIGHHTLLSRLEAF